MWVDCCRSLLALVIIIIIVMTVVSTVEMLVIRYRWTYVLEDPVASVMS
jgi:hypothetical protein